MGLLAAIRLMIDFHKPHLLHPCAVRRTDGCTASKSSIAHSVSTAAYAASSARRRSSYSTYRIGLGLAVAQAQRDTASSRAYFLQYADYEDERVMFEGEPGMWEKPDFLHRWTILCFRIIADDIG